MTDGLTDYLIQISKTPLLTRSEEIHLGKRIQAWLQIESPDQKLIRSGRRALDRMVTANLRLAVKLVMRIKPRLITLGIDLLDAVQEANCGLMKAAKRYDPSRGYRFSTYAFWWIKDALNRFIIANHGLIYIPMNILRLSSKAKTMLSLPEYAGSMSAVATALDENVQKICSAVRTVDQFSTSSLDKPVQTIDSKSSLSDFITDGVTTEPVDDFKWLYSEINKLSFNEKRFIELRFGELKTRSMALIAEELHLSKYQTICLQNRVLNKLRSQIEPMLSVS